MASSKYRADIDGLRAVAVLAVVGFHAFPDYFPGGFFGVDIFFVISGFLISGIIFDSLRQQTFSLVGFYARRVRRIFPALFLVMGACWAFAWIALYAGEFEALARQMLASTAFVSNFYFWIESGYFDAASLTKPLLHLWSLGVEEQFYVFWPVILFWSWKNRINTAWMIGGMLFVSLALFLGLPKIGEFFLTMGQNKIDLSQVFYSPAARFWELLMGAAWAYVSSREMPISMVKIGEKAKQIVSLQSGRHAVAGLGFFLIVGSVFILETPNASLGLNALWPTLGALFLIMSGPVANVNRRILSQPILTGIGLISYPLYLWHWPMLSFLYITENATAPAGLRLIAIFLSVILAWATYRFIERPVRFGGSGRAKILLLIFSMLVIWAIAQEALRHQGFVDRSDLIRQKARREGNNSFAPIQAKLNCQGKIDIPSCVALSIQADPTVALIGDSHAEQLFVGLEEHYKARNENLLNMSSCMILKDVRYFEDGEWDHCSKTRDLIFEYLSQSSSIKTVIVAFRGPLSVNGGGFWLSDQQGPEPKKRKLYHSVKKTLERNEDIFESGLRSTLSLLSDLRKEIIFVLDNPEMGFDPISCFDRPFSFLASPPRSPCAVKRPLYEERSGSYLGLATSVLKEFPWVRVVSPVESFCDERYCYAYRQDKFLYKDDDHFSTAGSILFGEYFFQQESFWRQD